MGGRPRQKLGSEPVNARSALGLRMLLSALFAPLFAMAAVGFAVAASRADGERTTLYAALAAGCGALALIALADLFMIARRRRMTRR